MTTKRELYDFINEHKLGVLATVSSLNLPEAAVVGIAVTTDLEIVFDTIGTSRKSQNLRLNPRIAFVVGWDDEITVQYEGEADEPKRQNMVFAEHVPEFVTACEASDAGQKSIEHLTGVLVACSAKEEELRKENGARLRVDGFRGDTMTLEQSRALDSFDAKQAAALFARFKRNGTWMCPTLSVLRAQAFIGEADFRNGPRLTYTQNFLRKQFWDDGFGFSSRTAEDNARARRVFQKQLEVVGMMKRAGVDFIAGTDTANPYVFPGFSLHDELALLVQAGFTPMEALQAATRDPARHLGRLDSVGTIEKGKIADLVLLDASPLTEIGNTRKINAVVVGGTLVTRPELDKMF